jgi:hypothetical protein
LARWRRPNEKAAAGEACNGWSESTRDRASNGAGGRGTRSGPFVQTDDRFVTLPLKIVHDEILAQR